MSATKHPAPSSPDAPLKGGMLWLAAIVLATANFMAVLDMTIANVSVATIAGSLGISSTQGTWVITSYAVAEAIVVPLTGWLAGRFGAVRVFATGMFMFGVFSALCGFATSLGTLVLFRILQGFAGGVLMPLSQTLLLKIFPKEKAPAATALWAMTTLVAPVVGPILGGWLCENYAWPVIFFINIPVVAVGVVMVPRLLGRYESTLVRSPIDVVGLVLLVIFVSALQIMLDTGREHDWFESGFIRGLLVVAVIGFLAFLIWELTEKNPIVDLRVFRHRGFTASVITLSLVYGSFFAANVLTPLWLQQNMGYTSTWAGLTTGWTGVLAVCFAPIAGVLMTKVDPRKIIFVGVLWLAFVSSLRSSYTTDATYWQIAMPLLFLGIGMPLFFVPLTALSLGSVEEKEVASAAGLQNFIRTLSGAFATSIVQTSWDNKTITAHAELSGLSDQSGEMVNGFMHAGATMEQALQGLDKLVQQQSVMIATNQVMAVIAVAFLVAAFVVWIAPRPTRAVDMTQAGH